MCTILSPQLSDFFSSLFPCGAHSACNVQGSPLKCESQGVLRLAACGSSFYGSVLCAFSLGLWQMLDADGWCLLMVLYMVLSDTLADRSMARRQQVCWKGCFTFTYFYWDFSGLLQVGLFLVAVHVIFPFVFCLWEGAGISSKKVPKVRKDFIHTGRKRKNATEDESNLHTHACKQMKTTCHTCLQASLHKHKTAGNKERQQENEESGQK